MPGEVPGNFHVLAPGRLQRHLIGVGQLQARDALLWMASYAALISTACLAYACMMSRKLLGRVVNLPVIPAKAGIQKRCCPVPVFSC